MGSRWGSKGTAPQALPARGPSSSSLTAESAAAGAATAVTVATAKWHQHSNVNGTARFPEGGQSAFQQGVSGGQLIYVSVGC
jgi:hypothetical protein